MFALGVLTGPDLEILEKSVTPPTGFKSFGANAETISRRLGVLDRFIAQQRGQIPQEIIEKVGPGQRQRQQSSPEEAVINMLPESLRERARQELAARNGQQQRQSTDDIDPALEAAIDEAFALDDDEIPDGVTPEEWEAMDEQDRALFR
jgi:hypothetical protein